jgi:two-component system, NarL family, nitrate/nitrite response regulator NarL
MIHLLLVDDHAMFREGLARSLEREADFRVVAQCSSATEAMPVLKKGVDLVLLDVDLGASRAMEFVQASRKAGYGGQILIVTAGISGQEAVQLIQSGVAGILHKQHSVQELCNSIRKVAAGESCLETAYLSALFRSVNRTRADGRAKLTERDRSVLRYILQGLTNKDIAARLEVSEGAVKASLRLLFDKLGTRTRAQLVKEALEHYRDQL